ncbi:MAG: nucleotidyltransferase family protein [Candidatus Cryptobacteroides sp.]
MTGPSTDAFFKLLRSGLSGQGVEDPEFRIPGDGWQSVYRESVRQTVTGIVHSSLEMLPDEALLDDALLVRWTAEVDRIERQGAAMDKVVADLVNFLYSQGLHPVLMKGQAAAALYLHPHRRECGDIDIYFNIPGEWKVARDILTGKGIKWSIKPDGSLCYMWKGVEVEHHRKLLDLCNPLARRRLKKMGPRFGLCSVRIGGTDVAVPSPEFDMLLMSSHIMKHAFGNGVGLRQLCDYVMRCRSSRCNPEEVRMIFATAGLLKWNRMLLSFLSEHLGLKPEEFPYDTGGPADSSYLLGLVLEGGNFGQYSGKNYVDGSFKFFCVLLRKLRTLGQYLKRLNFSFTLAPAEAVWTVISLAVGQLRFRRG